MLNAILMVRKRISSASDDLTRRPGFAWLVRLDEETKMSLFLVGVAGGCLIVLVWVLSTVSAR